MNSTEVAGIVKKIVDDFWASEISEAEARQRILNILDERENRIKVFRGNNPTAVFVRILGAKRLVAFNELIIQS